jgi:MATE family multidrug resistance protein
MASQNVLNLADSVMVGRLGVEAVAGVGVASSVNFQCQAALQGISSGVQAMSSRRIGENRPEVAAVPLNAALVIIVLLGVPMAIAAFIAAPSVVPTLTSDPAVVAAAVPYLRCVRCTRVSPVHRFQHLIAWVGPFQLTDALFAYGTTLRARVCAVPAVGINFAFRGFWNAVQQPQIYMNTLLAMHAVNVSISLALIFGVPMLKVRPGHTGPRTTASARRAPILEDFLSRRVSPPGRVPRFQSRRTHLDAFQRRF